MIATNNWEANGFSFLNSEDHERVLTLAKTDIGETSYDNSPRGRIYSATVVRNSKAKHCGRLKVRKLTRFTNEELLVCEYVDRKFSAQTSIYTSCISDRESFDAYYSGWMRAIDDAIESEREYRTLSADAEECPPTVGELREEAENEEQRIKNEVKRRFLFNGVCVSDQEQAEIHKATGRVECLARICSNWKDEKSDQVEELERFKTSSEVWKNTAGSWKGLSYKVTPISKDYPELPDHPPGFISDVIEYDLSTAQRKQPVFALMGAIALQAALCCRRVKSEFGTRPNVSIVCLGDSCSGKQHARDVSTNILTAAGADALLLGENFTSDIALFRAVEEIGAGLGMLDEIGRALAGGAKGDSQQYKIVTAMMQLATSENNAAFKPMRYADATRNIVLRNPCFCLYGTGTIEAFYQSCSTSSLVDGFLGRLLVVRLSESPHVLQKKIDVPESIVECAKYWYTLNGNLPDTNQGSASPKERVVPMDDDAIALLESFMQEADRLREKNRQNILWARAAEKASKLSIIYACSENMRDPKISADAMQWAIQLVKIITSKMVKDISNWISGSKFENDCNEVFRVILDQPNHKVDKTTLSQLYRKLNAKDKRNVIEALYEQGRIVIERTETKGRPKEVYKAIQ